MNEKKKSPLEESTEIIQFLRKNRENELNESARSDARKNLEMIRSLGDDLFNYIKLYIEQIKADFICATIRKDNDIRDGIKHTDIIEGRNIPHSIYFQELHKAMKDDKIDPYMYEFINDMLIESCEKEFGESNQKKNETEMTESFVFPIKMKKNTNLN